MATLSLNLTAMTVAKFVIGSSVSRVVRSYVKNAVDPENIIDQAQIWIAAMALGGLAGEACGDRLERKIAEMKPFIDELNERLQEAQVEAQNKQAATH